MNFHDTLIKLFPQFGNSIFQLNDVHIVLLVVEYLAGDTLGEFPIEVSTNDSFDKNVIGTNNFTPPYALSTIYVLSMRVIAKNLKVGSLLLLIYYYSRDTNFRGFRA